MLLVAGAARSAQQTPWEAIVGVLAVAASWLVVHTVFSLHYARLFHDEHSDQPAVDFNTDDDPDYLDFAYLGFTIGMTYQVSDSVIQSRPVRRAALRHALLSFLFGAVVVACTINLVIQLASS